MKETSLDSDVVPDAEPDRLTSDADGDVWRTDEHPSRLQLPDNLPNKIKMWLPPELKQKHADVLIVYAEKDRPDATRLQQAVNVMEFQPETGETIRAMACLYDDAEMCVWVTSYVDWLEHALKYSTLICVLFTDEFLHDPQLKEMANASFWESVIDCDKENCFIPVLLTDPRFDNSTTALSPYFKQRKPLSMYIDRWEYHMRATVRDHLRSRLEREGKQRRQQLDYIRSNRPQLLTEFSGLSATTEDNGDLQNHSVTDGPVTDASDPPSRYNYDSEMNLDAHAQQQRMTKPDEVGLAVNHLEPDTCDAATSGNQNTDIIEILLFAATFGIIFLTFFHQRQT